MNSKIESKIYLNDVSSSVTRLLSLLDRNPASSTFGCFDRQFWLHRKTDFPTSTAQMSMHSLALLYLKDLDGNILYQNQSLLRWVSAAIDYTCKIQNSDGSFDEWYPNERGWAGPTGYVAHALCNTVNLLENLLPKQTVARANECLRKAANHLGVRDEGDTLGNHFAIAILPLAEIGNRLNDSSILKRYEYWSGRFKETITEEGWALEYDGCDLGYTLGTLNFLAHLHHLTKETWIEEFARKSFGFLKYFFTPDGLLSGNLGSRHTQHFYPFALEYWAPKVSDAAVMLYRFRKSSDFKNVLLPADQEDHYIHYRLADYIKAAVRPVSVSEYANSLLPYEESTFTKKYFPIAGFNIQKVNDNIIWIAEKKGGALRVYSLTKNRLIYLNNGCVIIDDRENRYSSLWQGSTCSSSKKIKIEGECVKIFSKQFTVAKFVIFRVICLLMSNALFAYYFKRYIRSIMVTGKTTSCGRWERSISIDSLRIEIVDRIKFRPGCIWEKIFFGGNFQTRYVPQSSYFTKAELNFEATEIVNVSKKMSQQITAKTEFSYAEGIAEVCVQ